MTPAHFCHLYQIKQAVIMQDPNNGEEHMLLTHLYAHETTTMPIYSC